MKSRALGLRADGTVVAIGTKYSLKDWYDIVAIACGNNTMAGLRADGTVVTVNENYDSRCDVSGWTDIVAIAVGKYLEYNSIVGLKSDGTVVSSRGFYQRDLSNWNNIGSMSEQTKNWYIQGLCRFCGGQLGGFLSKKCKSCGQPE